MDEDNNIESQHIDAAYIPPDVDTLNDEEDMNDNINLQQFGELSSYIHRMIQLSFNSPVIQQLLNLNNGIHQMMKPWNSKEDICFLQTTVLLLLLNGRKVRLSTLTHLYLMN